MNENIDKLIDWFNFQTGGKEEFLVLPSVEGGDSRLLTRTQVRNKIKKILGVDKQCSQCSEYCFDGDLSLIEGTEKLICQNCAEGIINGDIKVRE